MGFLQSIKRSFLMLIGIFVGMSFTYLIGAFEMPMNGRQSFEFIVCFFVSNVAMSYFFLE
jgi:hypothetical protein